MQSQLIMITHISHKLVELNMLTREDTINNNQDMALNLVKKVKEAPYIIISIPMTAVRLT